MHTVSAICLWATVLVYNTVDRCPYASRMPGCTSKAANLMCRKALFTFNIGYPAKTITTAMRMADWHAKHVASDAWYLSGGHRGSSSTY